MRSPGRYSLRFLLIAIAALLLLEAALRLLFGFGEIPVYYSSSQYEYALQPDQDITRFGSHVYINREGMRSAELKSGERRILKFGDSVLNGGVRLDNNQLCSSLLEVMLKSDFPKARALNVSAGSWGPENAFAWVKKHGDFDAEAIFLVFSSHDWTDTMTFRDVVGNVPFYPAEEPVTAIGDAATWIYSRYFEKIDWQHLPVIPHPQRNTDDNRGWKAFIRYADAENIPLRVYHHPELSELKSGKWNENGRALEDFLENSGVISISGLEIGLNAHDYSDNIHLLASGHEKMAEAMYPPAKSILHDR